MKILPDERSHSAVAFLDAAVGYYRSLSPSTRRAPTARPNASARRSRPLLVNAIFLVNAEDLTDVGVIEASRRLRFADQACLYLFLVECFAREELQRNGPAELGVLGLVNDTHAALTELFGDLVLQYGPTDHDEGIVTLRSHWKGWHDGF